MALKGLDTTKPIAYVPEVERSNEENPTIFWVLPRNSRQNYEALNKYSDASKTDKNGNTKINASQMFNADTSEFLSRVKKVENYQFSAKFPQYLEKGNNGVMTIDNEEMMQDLINDLDPAIFQEVLDASSQWSVLKEGEKKGLRY